MCCRQTICDTRQQFDALAPGSWFRGGPIAQRTAIHEFRNDVLFSLPVTGVVDRNDMRMIQRGCQLSLALKTFACHCIADFGGQELHRDGPVQVRIECTIHDTHTAFAEQCVNPVLSSSRADFH